MNRNRLVAVIAVVALVAGGAAIAIAVNQPDTMPESTAQQESQPEPQVQETEATEPEAAAPTAGSYVDYSEEALAGAEGDRVLFFHAPWCPQCRALEADIRAGEIPTGLTIFKVDYDSSTGLRQQYGVTLQTTVVYVGENGEELSKQVLYDDTTLAALIAAAP